MARARPAIPPPQMAIVKGFWPGALLGAGLVMVGDTRKNLRKQARSETQMILEKTLRNRKNK